MVMVKRLVSAGVLFFSTLSLVMGQSSNTAGSRELSVEESYLQEAVEMMIIREQSRSDSREMKMIALEYIESAIKRGNTGEEIRSALEYLAIEGTINQARENGRLVNNYPDVRTKAVMYLGQLGTPEARGTLLRVARAEPEPMVLTETFKSLGKNSGDDPTEVVNTVGSVLTKFNALNPDNLLALAALDVYDTVARNNSGKLDINAVQMIIQISEGPYTRPVQQKAQQVIRNLRTYAQAGSANRQ
ncbi:hypothetical protein FACS1894141_0710 [Spirochaetia bacterium]|nr:hypothetical protein FACS1894141_0710 [Spirochaetia bacterium]